MRVNQVLLQAPAECRDELRTHLVAAGLVVSSACGPHDAAPHVPVVGVWLGPSLASGTHAWLRDSRPHLVVSLSATCVRIGPFVDPGLTACHYCLDAADAGGTPGPPRVPPPGVLAVAAGWVAHDVRRWHEGSEPTTWSSTVLVDTDLAVTRRRWLRHPHCGCGWGLSA